MVFSYSPVFVTHSSLSWMLHPVKSFIIPPDPDVFYIVTAGECVDPLVSGLYASSFLASSRYNFLYSANFAKLYGKCLNCHIKFIWNLMPFTLEDFVRTDIYIWTYFTRRSTSVRSMMALINASEMTLWLWCWHITAISYIVFYNIKLAVSVCHT